MLLLPDNCVRLLFLVGHNHQVAPSFIVRLPCSRTKQAAKVFRRTFLAVRTGLEPATPGVTGRYSNQLNYRTNCSDLCVFLERGCKGTHFFETSKYFLHFFQKICTFRLVSTKMPLFVLGSSLYGFVSTKMPLFVLRWLFYGFVSTKMPRFVLRDSL